MDKEQIQELAEKISARLMVTTKRVLSLDEVLILTGLSKSHLYKLTSSHQIPFYKPNGKMVYFEREEVERWMLQNRASSQEEIQELANNHLDKEK